MSLKKEGHSNSDVSATSSRRHRPPRLVSHTSGAAFVEQTRQGSELTTCAADLNSDLRSHGGWSNASILQPTSSNCAQLQTRERDRPRNESVHRPSRNNTGRSGCNGRSRSWSPRQSSDGRESEEEYIGGPKAKEHLLSNTFTLSWLDYRNTTLSSPLGANIDHADPAAFPQQLPRCLPSTFPSNTKITAEHIIFRSRRGLLNKSPNNMDILTTNLQSAISKLQLVRRLEPAANTTAEAKRLLHIHNLCTALLISRKAIPRPATQCLPPNSSPAFSTLTRVARLRTTEQTTTELPNTAGVATMGRSFAEIETRE